MRVRDDISVRYWQALGSRKTMEDVICVERKLHNGLGDFYIGLFDGHGGVYDFVFDIIFFADACCRSTVAEYLSKHLCRRIEERFQSKKHGGDVKRAMLEGMEEINKDILEQPWGRHCGSTALVMIVRKDTLHIANVGDCRAVLVNADSSERLTHDHKVSDGDEHARITEAGGVIRKGRLHADGCDTNLARAFGDAVFHPYLNAKPDYFERRITDADQFIVLGCDGIWDHVQETAAARSVRMVRLIIFVMLVANHINSRATRSGCARSRTGWVDATT